ncbi:unnamed protein product, partial [Amoebophrya sp. A120]|eukprot:GSA120T00011923001.1
MQQERLDKAKEKERLQLEQTLLSEVDPDAAAAARRWSADSQTGERRGENDPNKFDQNDPFFKENPLQAIRNRVGLTLMEKLGVILSKFFGGDEETELLKRADAAKERNRFTLINRFQTAQEKKTSRDKAIHK